MSTDGEHNDRNQDRELVLTLRKLHRSEQAVEFIRSCKINKVVPLFAKMAQNTQETLKKCQYSPSKIVSFEQKRLNSELNLQLENIEYLQCKISSFYSLLRKQTPDLGLYERNKSFIEAKIYRLEKHRDINRNKKLKKLISRSNGSFLGVNYAEILNLTSHNIPEEISNFARFGRNYGIGGKEAESEIFLEFNNLFKKFKSKALEENIDEMEIASIKCETFLTSQNVKKCKTFDNRIPGFLNFKKLNNSLSIYCDKSPCLAYISEEEYKAKLCDLFDNEKFTRIQNFKIEKELKAFRLLFRATIGPFISNISLMKLAPLNTIAHCYGSLKAHKPLLPLRPIYTAYCALTNPVEEYLKKIFEPLLSKCDFLLSSTKDFKKTILAENPDFNHETNEIVSFDAKSLYTSVNIPKVVNYILNIIYKSPRDYFPRE